MSVDMSYVSGHTIGQCTHDPILAAEMVIGDFRLH
jgi:hypothetical protein